MVYTSTNLSELNETFVEGDATNVEHGNAFGRVLNLNEFGAEAENKEFKSGYEFGKKTRSKKHPKKTKKGGNKKSRTKGILTTIESDIKGGAQWIENIIEGKKNKRKAKFGARSRSCSRFGSYGHGRSSSLVDMMGPYGDPE